MLVWGTKQIFDYNLDINFIHTYFFLFWAEVGIMLLVARYRPNNNHKSLSKPTDAVNMKPWRLAPLVTVILITAILFVYILFSPIGLAFPHSIVSPWFWPATGILILVFLVTSHFAHRSWYFKYEAFILKSNHCNPKK